MGALFRSVRHIHISHVCFHVCPCHRGHGDILLTARSMWTNSIVPGSFRRPFRAHTDEGNRRSTSLEEIDASVYFGPSLDGISIALVATEDDVQRVPAKGS